MKHYRVLFALFTVIALFSGSAQAADNVSREISDAIAKGDYKTAQTLISQNPDVGGASEIKLLSIANSDLPGNPESASQALTLGSNVSPYIDEASASKVASSDKALSESVLKSSSTADGKAAANGFTPDMTVALLNSALTIAQSKAVAAADPDLAPTIQSELETYADANDVLLAQIPNRNFSPNNNAQRFYQPQFIPPANSGGSPL